MFSVVMPVWNKRRFLGDAIASVLAQQWTGFELVAVDDGSTDGSFEMLRGHTDPRIRLIAQANAGPGPARNAGIEAAAHDWIAFLDADDLWLPDHLAELDRVRRLNPDAGLIGTAYSTRESLGPASCPAPGAIAPVDYFAPTEGARGPFCASSTAIPRATYAALGGFAPGVPGEDRAYWAKIALARPVAASTRVTAIYRPQPDGITATVPRKWQGKSPLALADLSAVAALLAARRPQLGSDLGRRVDRFLAGEVQLAIRAAAAGGDFAAVRMLARPAAGIRMPATERLILAASRLPVPLARTAYRFAGKLKALGWAFGDRLLRAGGSRADRRRPAPG